MEGGGPQPYSWFPTIATLNKLCAQAHLHRVSTTPVSDTVPDVFGGLAFSDVAKPPVVMLVTGELIPVQHGFHCNKSHHLTFHIPPDLTPFLQDCCLFTET
jgi:hypothetical protein